MSVSVSVSMSVSVSVSMSWWDKNEPNGDHEQRLIKSEVEIVLEPDSQAAKRAKRGRLHAGSTPRAKHY